MINDWLSTTPTAVWLVLVSGTAILVATIAFVRLNGLRSLSKMSAFDFPVTVAIGSIIATVTVSSTSLLNGVIGLAALLLVQRVLAVARETSIARKILDNEPLLLLRHGEMLEDNLRKARVTKSDIYAKLREANCIRMADAHAVVLESTGDISVLHGGDGVDDCMLDGVLA